MSVLFACCVLTVGIQPTHAQNRNQQPRLHESRSTTPAEAAARTQRYIVEEIRHRLVTLPYYDVFDWLEGQVLPDGMVVLRGQVVRPTTKSDAVARVQDIEGVARVDDQIEVLPLSPSDDQLRIALYRAIYGFDSPLFRYATRAVPPIHIIVRNRRAVLKGIVANEGDKNFAYVRARGVPGLFEVTNDLQVERTD